MALRFSSHRRWFVGEPLQTLTFSTQSVGLDHLGNVGVELEALRSAPVSSLNLLFLFFLLLLETFFALNFFWVLERVSLRFGLRERSVACVPKDSWPCSHGVPQPRPSGRTQGGTGHQEASDSACLTLMRSTLAVAMCSNGRDIGGSQPNYDISTHIQPHELAADACHDV